MSARQRYQAIAEKALGRAAEKALEHGLPEEQLGGVLAEAQVNVIQKLAPDFRASLRDDSERMLAEHHAMWADVEHELRTVWGPALDQLYEFIVVAEESCMEHVHERQEEGAGADPTFQVLIQLVAAGTRTAVEVWQLLRHGLAAGAAARARSLHELSVVATVISEYRDSEVALRFQDHIAIDQLGYLAAHHPDELSDRDRENLAALEKDRDRLIEKYGRRFAMPYGWAAHLISPDRRPGLRPLEELADLQGWLPSYIGSSQAVHPTSWSSVLNMEGPVIVTSWRTTGLGNPALNVLPALHHLVWLLFTLDEDLNALDMLIVQVLGLIREEAEAAFLDAHTVAEAALEENLTSRGD